MRLPASETVAIVSHDAGGAEILSSLLKRDRPAAVCALAGPALNVFGRKLPAMPNMKPEEAIGQADWLLCGTSWQSSLERDAILIAKQQGKRSVAFLDHWTNYPERFGHPAPMVLPDELWVGDEHAFALARQCFPAVPVTLVGNSYWDELNEFTAIRTAGMQGVTRDLLYIGQPVAEPAAQLHGDPLYWGYTEDQALRFLLARVRDLDPIPERLVIRPHPSEPDDKYDWVAGEATLPVTIDRTADLLEQISSAYVVAGCASMAMVMALRLGKTVLGAIPDNGVACSLPFPEIIHLRSTHGRISVHASTSTRYGAEALTCEDQP